MEILEKLGLAAEIVEFMSNLIGSAQEEARAWNGLLLGCAAGDDPIFEKFKQAVDERHYTPAELFNRAFPHENARADELSVLCWILPQRRPAREANRAETKLPSELWGRAKVEGERFYNRWARNLRISSPRAECPQFTQWDIQNS